MYQGEYHGSKKHQPDLDAVLERAWKHDMDKMMVTSGSLNDAKTVLDIIKKHQSEGTMFKCLTCTLHCIERFF